MIYVTNAKPVNDPGEPELGRREVWQGLDLKAKNALPFVPAMTESRCWSAAATTSSTARSCSAASA